MTTTREAERGYGIFLPLPFSDRNLALRPLAAPPSLPPQPPSVRPSALARSLCAFFTPGRAGLKLGGRGREAVAAAAVVRSDKHYFCITAGLSSGFLNETFHIQRSRRRRIHHADRPSGWRLIRRDYAAFSLGVPSFFSRSEGEEEEEAKMKGGERLRSREWLQSRQDIRRSDEGGSCGVDCP